MQESTRQKLLEKNKKLIDMVIERAKRDFPEDIAIIGLTGSFSTGDYHEKSDLDLIIINETDQGWGISAGFILEDVGYDVYCTPWKPRLEAQSKLESPMASCLLELQVLYCAKPEYMDKLAAYQNAAKALLAQPIGEACLARAKKYIDTAKQNYAEAMLATELGEAKFAAGGVLYETVNALTSLNNTYIKRGIKRYLEQMLSYDHLPEDFETLYMAVINANTIDEARTAAGNLLSALISLYESMHAKYTEQTKPTYEDTRGIYEELWCNCRNKILNSVAMGDRAYAYHAALGAQAYLDVMVHIAGMKKYNLMASFDANNLSKLQEAFLRIVDEYAAVYAQVGRKIERFDTFEAVYDAYMGNELSS